MGFESWPGQRLRTPSILSGVRPGKDRYEERKAASNILAIYDQAPMTMMAPKAPWLRWYGTVDGTIE